MNFLSITELRQILNLLVLDLYPFKQILLLSVVDEGHLYVWGSNKHGQLVSRDIFLAEPKKIDSQCFSHEKIGAVWSGWTHLVAQTGRISIKQ